MNRYEKYSYEKFNVWRNKVKERLPKLVISFYQDNKYHDYEKHVMLGRIIEHLNNPFYSITKSNGNRLDSLGRMSSMVSLEILVNEFFK